MCALVLIVFQELTEVCHITNRGRRVRLGFQEYL